ncbi:MULTISPECIES: hypothetical protein [Candidatus Ichthyocystis]|uniref:Uncharacterized protein n=1 Tax=Candidatus Ichthyocystis hellenicum TaxID=1561003 RepID=A0A0S4M2F4_9BURK|nr:MULTISPECIES: hypothetical protein [Ichthyocystis]CUT17957.1 hypothetical protein Ark11_1144 [Candidatus Ichthyocystis hellenicum]
MESVHGITSNKKHEAADEHSYGITQIITDSKVIGESDMPCRTFHCISGINISSGITQIDPMLVDSASVADIVHSIENNSLSGYIASMDNFTAKFMSKSLQYVRAFRFEPNPIGVGPLPSADAYIGHGRNWRSRHAHEFVLGPSNHNANIRMDLPNTPSESTDDIDINILYGRLQYMCDYFKYYVLEDQFECLPYVTKREKKSPSLLSNIDKEIENKQPISVKFPSEEVSLAIQDGSDYEKFITSIRKECCDLIIRKEPAIEAKNIKSLKISYLDNSTKDTLIKSLMEYYLLITEKFESMADLKFKYGDKHLDGRIVLPVPREVAEVVHEEIETRRTTSNYHDSKVEHFFCDGNRCLCISSSGTNNNPKTDRRTGFALRLIRRFILEDIVNRMKRYISSLNT